jgi:hypothetical protein
MTLRDPDIREPLLAMLRALGHIAVTEFSVHDRRADVAAITESELILYEIKSDTDTNIRLQGQADAYDTVASRLYLVTTPKKLPSMVGIIPPWWGILLARETPEGVVLEEVQDARENPAFTLLKAYSLLWSPELDGILDAHSLPMRTGKVKALRCKRIVSSLDSHTAKSVWLSALRTRYITYPELQGNGKRAVL